MMLSEWLPRIGYAALSLFFIMNYGLLLFGFVMRIVARAHGRIGPPVWQPYINILKTLSMRTWGPSSA